MFRAAPTRVRVPATSANLGPGFDAFGAGARRSTTTSSRRSRTTPECASTCTARVPTPCRATTATSWPRRCCAPSTPSAGARAACDLVCANRIPHGRGLGSSAAAIVSGLRAGPCAGRRGRGAPARRGAARAGELDRGAPGQRGRVPATAASRWPGSTQASGTRVLRVEADPRIVPVVCVPVDRGGDEEGPRDAARDRARTATPPPTPRARRCWSRRSPAVSTCCSRRPTTACTSPTAEPRGRGLPTSSPSCARPASPATVSGAGPTVLALADASSAPRVEGLAGARFATTVLEFDTAGARLVPLEG